MQYVSFNNVYVGLQELTLPEIKDFGIVVTGGCIATGVGAFAGKFLQTLYTENQKEPSENKMNVKEIASLSFYFALKATAITFFCATVFSLARLSYWKPIDEQLAGVTRAREYLKALEPHLNPSRMDVVRDKVERIEEVYSSYVKRWMTLDKYNLHMGWNIEVLEELLRRTRSAPSLWAL